MTPSGAGEDLALDRRRALGLFVLILLARLAIAAAFRGNPDSESFRIAAEAALAGQSVYAATGRYDYNPVWAYVLAGLWKLTRPDFSRFVLAIGLFATASDAASAALVFRIARRIGRTEPRARLAALLFFANPVSVLAACAHGQVDALAILPLLAAILAAMEGAGLAERRRAAWVTALLSVSLLIKPVTAFHALLFWRRLRRPGLSDAALAVPYTALAASLLPFAGAAGAIWENVFYGARGATPSALTALLEIPRHPRPILLAVFLGAVLWALGKGRGEELPRAALLLWLAMLVALPTYGIEYLAWPLSVGALYPSAGLALYVFAGAIFHSSWSLELAWPLSFSSLGTWLAAALWLAGETVGLREERAMPRVWNGTRGASAA